MAQPIIEKLKVDYVKYENGQTSKHTCLLKDIPQEDKQYIVSLSILPVYNIDGSENIQKKDISEYIKDFPILTTLAYPSQFTSINVGKIQSSGCPNLQTILRSEELNSLNETRPIAIQGKNRVVFDNSNLEEKFKTYANMLQDGQNIVSVIEVSPKKATKTKTSVKKQYLTSEELDTKISQLDSKLEDIMSIVDNPNKIPTKENLKRTLNGFVGRITSEQFEEIVSAIQGININIDKDALQTAVDDALNAGINKILAQEETKTNKAINDLVREILELKQSNQEDNKNEMEILELLRKKVPDLIATNRALTDKVFLRLNDISNQMVDAEGRSVHDKLDDISAYSDLISEELVSLDKKFDTAFKEVGLDEETKLYISKLLNIYAKELNDQRINGNQDLFNAVRDELKKVVTAEQIDGIISEKLRVFGNEMSRANALMGEACSYLVTDNIIRAIGGLVDNDFNEIKEKIEKLFSDTSFTTNLERILKDSDLAKESSLEEIKRLIDSNRQEEKEAIQACAEKLEDIPNMSQMKELFESYSEGLADYLIRKMDIDRESVEATLSTHDEKMDARLGEILEAVKSSGMTINDLKNFMSSKEGREAFATALGISALQANNQTIISNQAELSQRMTQLEESIKSILNLNLNIYNNSYGLARGAVVGGAGVVPTPVMGVYGYIPTGFAPYMVYPYNNFTYQAPSTATTAEMNVIVNNAVRQQLQLIFGQLGVQIPGQPSDINDKDKIIKELNEKIAQRDEEIAELKGQIKELSDRVDKLVKGLEDKKKEESKEDKKSETEETTSPTKKEEQKLPQKKIEPTIELPNLREEAFIKESIEDMEKLAEPKMTVGKRFRKWIARHPLALTAIGIGAGAVLGAGAGVALAGGVSALIAKASWFIPTLQTIGIGAGVGLGLGAVGEIVARATGMGKKSKLYSKFQKERNNCERFRDQMEYMDKQVEMAQEDLKASRELQRTGNKILKKLGVYKFATKANRKALRKLKAKARIQKAEYKGKVEKFLKAKEELNQEEERTGKTTAMGGYLQKLRNEKSKYNDRVNKAISRGADQDELEDLSDEFEDIKSEIVENAMDSGIDGDITKLSEDYLTGDKDAEDIINSVKGTKTALMEEMEKDIKRRNSKVKPEVVKAKYYDPDELGAYKNLVEKKGNEADKKNLQELMEHAKSMGEEASKIVSDPNVTPAQDYLKKHTNRAKEIMELLNSAQEKATNATAKDTEEHTK